MWAPDIVFALPLEDFPAHADRPSKSEKQLATRSQSSQQVSVRFVSVMAFLNRVMLCGPCYSTEVIEFVLVVPGLFCIAASEPTKEILHFVLL